MKKKNDQNVVAWIYATIGKEKWYVVILVLVQALLGSSGVFYAMILRNVIDMATMGEKRAFLLYASFLIILTIVQIGLRAIGRWIVELARSAMENRFKGRLFSTLLHKDYASVTAIHSGEWMNRLTSDTTVVVDSVVSMLPGAVGMSVKLIAALIMMFYLEPRFGMFLIPGGCILMMVTYGFRKVLKRLHKQIQEKDGKVRVLFQEYLGSLLVVRSFAMEEQVEQDAKRAMGEHRKARMKRNHFSNICNIGFGMAMNGAYLFGAIWCAWGILQGKISYGTLTAMLQLISQIQSPFANITGYMPRYYAMLASAERLIEAEQFLDDCPNGSLPFHKILSCYQNSFRGLALKDVSFSYSRKNAKLDNTYELVVLDNINLTINKGEYVAVTGQSGCGKSTLLKLLLCLYELKQGERLILEKEKNQELTSAWHKLFAYVPQGNHLMSGTIREIIAFSDKNRMQEEEKLWNACKIACAEEFINELKNGLDTILGERGQGLSEGQMQRIAIARAIFSEHPILILDESTSALDENTEKQLLDNLHTMTDKTVIIVTHRPAVLAICNKIVEIRKDGVKIKDTDCPLLIG